MKKRVETGVTNGDCLAACLAAMFECMSIGYVRKVHQHDAAAKLRSDLVRWIETHWLLPCFFNPDMCFHEIFHLAHDVGIPPAERKRCGGPWPDDPAARLGRYLRNKVYMCEAEQVAFVCMMHERGINFCLRNWRADRDNPPGGFLVSMVPDAEHLERTKITDIVVVDIELTGDLDSRNAHYKLLNSASLLGLARAMTDKKARKVFEHTPPGTYSPDESTASETSTETADAVFVKRRRIIDDDELENC